MTAPAAPTRVLIDTDVDLDDWMAILLLLQHPDTDVIGITVTGCGACYLTPGTRNALDLLMLVPGMADIPVAMGAKRPLLYSNQFSGSLRQSVNSLYGLSLPTNPAQPDPRDAVTFLKETLEAEPEPVTVLAIGGGTNLGTLLREHPHCADKIARVHVMGGAIDVPGNVASVDDNYNNEVAEWNIFIDPLGAKLLLESGVPVTLVPLDASNWVPFDMSFYGALAAEHRTPAAEFIYQVFVKNQEFVLSGDFYAWDPLAAATIIDASLVSTVPMQLSVALELDEEQDTSGQLCKVSEGPTLDVGMKADDLGFKALFLSTLNRS